MKKIKYFLMLLLGVVLSVSVISCSKDDDDDAKSGPYADSPILGSWEYNDGWNNPRTYTFKADGTFIYNSTDYHGDPIVESGTFQTDNKSVLRLVTTQADNKKNLGAEEFRIEIVENVYISISYTKYYKK